MPGQTVSDNVRGMEDPSNRGDRKRSYLVSQTLILKYPMPINLFLWIEEHDKNEPQPPPPIERGDVIQVRLLSALSIEEYVENDNANPSFIHDPSFKSSEWQNSVAKA